MKETVETRAVQIAAKIMTAASLCRYDTPTKCRRAYANEAMCDKCLESWLISKARKELNEETNA